MVYTRHAGERMEERGISDAEVHEAMANTVEVRPGRYGGHQRVVIGLTEAGRKLKLVLAYDNEPPDLITVSVVGEYP